ncbi:hypothetical protein TTHERM_00624680 (macronuclear) [Tetrahymena thermophila SB210]|uniref:Transmembrane protein n=1 Tax=Tetrahymena thermophila (strain SB210) TaxID=312017 RepID=Q240R5_TETTS|nr:hypothetical protein TTHERM_00624680 [Tetrahymena thermophila SB210]EAS02349.1 hypothetical protein TTHERM_00624680 [Tetrahymena thermophila SB210]|eukprot:XP_001022594.1 hypothetical protein TTHERM_00624680 [Tetrahymena thermophila SB210]
MSSFCSFLWGVAIGSSVMYQVSPRYYNPIKKNVILPTQQEFKKQELDGWSICGTLGKGIKNSVVEMWKQQQ